MRTENSRASGFDDVAAGDDPFDVAFADPQVALTFDVHDGAREHRSGGQLDRHRVSGALQEKLAPCGHGGGGIGERCGEPVDETAGDQLSPQIGIAISEMFGDAGGGRGERVVEDRGRGDVDAEPDGRPRGLAVPREDQYSSDLVPFDKDVVRPLDSSLGDTDLGESGVSRRIRRVK